jgi:hypothetical protein
MRRRQWFVACAGVAALVVFGGVFCASWEEIAAWRRSVVVRQLFEPSKREAIWREVVGWQRYVTSTPRNRINVNVEEQISEVLLCPQLQGMPLVAVFFVEGHNNIRNPERHYELLRMDGTLIPDPQGWDLTWVPFRDINGDSVLDRVENMTFGFRYNAAREPQFCAIVLQVVPITEAREPSLMVAYGRTGTDLLKWRLVESERQGVFDVVFENGGEGTGKPEVRALYGWSDGRYLGPTGSIDGEFLRVDGDRESLEKFALHKFR